MIAVLSPAKSLDFSQINIPSTEPRFLKEANQLVGVMKTKSEQEVRELMDISEKLAILNVERYHQFDHDHGPQHSKPCLFAFTGDVYQGLKAQDFDHNDAKFAQDHVRILSGMYGLLRPLDRIQPYRLEMGTRLTVNGDRSLYEVWKRRITPLLEKDLNEQGDDILINLASQEYFTAIERENLKARVIDVEFKDRKNEEYKIISFYAKKARGMMARFIVKNKIHSIEELRDFCDKGYWFDEEGSTPTKLAFKRDH